jgi:fructoselysine-6-P-deglycase FrlB-like protein
MLEPPIRPNDVIIGLASSGRTPYVLGGLKFAREAGAATVGIACVKPSRLKGLCDILIECVTGPEVVTGSTRLKAGTATKMVSIIRICANRADATANVTRSDPQYDFNGVANPYRQDIWQSRKQLGRVLEEAQTNLNRWWI